MKTTDQIVALLYQRLNVPQVTSVITGKIYLYDRPETSTSEDIVLNCLPVTNTQPQMATANVNIYVNDLHAEVGGKAQYLVNTARLKALAAAVIPIIENGASGDYMFSVGSQSTLRERELHASILNVRVDFLIVNN